MTTLGWPLRLGAALIVIYLMAGLPVQIWSYWVSPLPLMNYGPPVWPNFPACGIAAPWAAYLMWRRSPRARIAAYVFLAFDVLRSLNLTHWLPIAVDVGIILYLQTPAMRRLYPSVWSRRRAIWRSWSRRKRDVP